MMKFPWRREWLLNPVFLPGEFHGQRSLAGYSPQGQNKSDTTEWLTLFSHSRPPHDQRAHKLMLKCIITFFFYLKIIENYLQNHAQNLLTFLGPKATRKFLSLVLIEEKLFGIVKDVLKEYSLSKFHEVHMYV